MLLEHHVQQSLSGEPPEEWLNAMDALPEDEIESEGEFRPLRKRRRRKEETTAEEDALDEKDPEQSESGSRSADSTSQGSSAESAPSEDFAEESESD